MKKFSEAYITAVASTASVLSAIAFIAGFTSDLYASFWVSLAGLIVTGYFTAKSLQSPTLTFGERLSGIKTLPSREWLKRNKLSFGFGLSSISCFILLIATWRFGAFAYVSIRLHEGQGHNLNFAEFEDGIIEISHAGESPRIKEEVMGLRFSSELGWHASNWDHETGTEYIWDLDDEALTSIDSSALVAGRPVAEQRDLSDYYSLKEAGFGTSFEISKSKRSPWIELRSVRCVVEKTGPEPVVHLPPPSKHQEETKTASISAPLIFHCDLVASHGKPLPYVVDCEIFSSGEEAHPRVFFNDSQPSTIFVYAASTEPMNVTYRIEVEFDTAGRSHVIRPVASDLSCSFLSGANAKQISNVEEFSFGAIDRIQEGNLKPDFFRQQSFGQLQQFKGN